MVGHREQRARRSEQTERVARHLRVVPDRAEAALALGRSKRRRIEHDEVVLFAAAARADEPGLGLLAKQPVLRPRSDAVSDEVVPAAFERATRKIDAHRARRSAERGSNAERAGVAKQVEHALASSFGEQAAAIIAL